MPVVPSEIRKRNGLLVRFDSDKITVAVQKAFFAVTKKPHEEEARLITDDVLKHLEIFVLDRGQDFVPGVEDIQDLVELSIMERDFHEVARTYIVYRFQHAKIRENAKEEVQEKIEKSELLVEKNDGRKELFDLGKIRRTITRASQGIEKDIDTDALIEQCKREVYDGISTRDIANSLVLVARSFIERDPSYSKLAARLLQQTVIYKDALGNKHTKDHSFDEWYRRAFVENIQEAVELGLLDKRMLNFDLDQVAAKLYPKRDDLLQYLGVQTLLDRYFLRDKRDHGRHRILEAPQHMWMRVAMGLALNEDRKEDRAASFYEMLSTLRFVSSTPTLFHAGTVMSQLSSCYLGVVEDSLESIFKAYSDYANMAKVDGGVGYSWSKVRATGASVKTTNVDSNGVIPFLKIADSTTITINRSGRRRGAHCIYIETWHYDIEDFLELRKNTGDERRRTHELNTANWIPDLFMKRVRDDKEWTLFSPDETPDLVETYGREFEKRYRNYEQQADRGELHIWKRVRARDLWKKMLTQLFETGHPWITFKDSSNIRSPQDHVGVIHNSNLCTEITLNTSADNEVAVCNLGSVNLAKHMTDGSLDRDALKETVTVAMRMLDNVIDLNYYPIPETRRANMRHRPVGLGLMGFQDALFIQNIAFDSEESVRFADFSMELISYYAISASSELARERGAYQSYKDSKWDRGIFPVDTLDLLEQERNEKVLVDRECALDWAPVREAVRRHGMRNSNCLAMAPTATISNIAGAFPTIEPIYKNIYVKANISGTFIVVNQYLVEDLKKEGLWNSEMLEIIKGKEGSIQSISSVPEWIKKRHKEVFEIDSRWLVKAAAHRGKWIDQSQSLNIFFNGMSGTELSEIYMYAWASGLKTTYYLRTLGASGVEQSTVSLGNQERLDKEATTKASAAVKAVAAMKEAVSSGGQAVIEPTTKDDTNLCLVDDPECESCQ